MAVVISNFDLSTFRFLRKKLVSIEHVETRLVVSALSVRIVVEYRTVSTIIRSEASAHHSCPSLLNLISAGWD